MTHKIIIDTDPGIDDAMAIFFAFQAPDIEVIGLTTVFGNVSADLAAQNALTLCDLSEKDIPVTKGASMPWVGPESTYSHYVHGDDGFGNINAPKSNRKLDPRNSAQFIIDMAQAYPGEITIVAIGPLTNLALALRLEPKLPQLLKGVSLMGGAAFVPGNVTPTAEANIHSDAHAAEIVFAADWPLTMFGLDVTNDVPFAPDFVDTLERNNNKLGGFVKRASQFYYDFYSRNRDDRVCFFHDAFPIAHLIQPDLFELTEGHVRIGTGELDHGQTTLAPKGSTSSPLWTQANTIKAATKVNHTQLEKLFTETYSL